MPYGHHTSRPFEQPVGIALIGRTNAALKFLAQSPLIPWIRISSISSNDVDSWCGELRDRLGWDAAAFHDDNASVLRDRIFATNNPSEAIARRDVDIVIEATGGASEGLRAFQAACWARRDVVVASAELDALLGPILARHARTASVKYSLSSCGAAGTLAEKLFLYISAGYRPVGLGRRTAFSGNLTDVTPDDCLARSGLTADQAKIIGHNTKTLTAWMDGTTPALQLTSVANATGYRVPNPGEPALRHAGYASLAEALAQQAPEETGTLHLIDPEPKGGVAEYSFLMHRSLNRWQDALLNSPVMEGMCEGAFLIDEQRTRMDLALYASTIHSMRSNARASVCPVHWMADVVAVARQDLTAGEVLQGSGSRELYGTLVSAKQSLADRALPIGLAQGCRLRRGVRKGTVLRKEDVELDSASQLVSLRLAMESAWQSMWFDGTQAVDYQLLDCLEQ